MDMAEKKPMIFLIAIEILFFLTWFVEVSVYAFYYQA